MPIGWTSVQLFGVTKEFLKTPAHKVLQNSSKIRSTTVASTPALSPLPRIPERNPIASSRTPISLWAMGIIRVIDMTATNKKQWINGISWWRTEQAVNKRNAAAVNRNILCTHKLYKRFLFWNSVLKDSVPILSCSKMPSFFFGKVIFPRRRVNKKIETIRNVINIKKSWIFP